MNAFFVFLSFWTGLGRVNLGAGSLVLGVHGFMQFTGCNGLKLRVCIQVQQVYLYVMDNKILFVEHLKP